MSIGIIGAGHWGENLIRNFFQLGALHTVCDMNPDILEKIQHRFPKVNTTQNFDDLLSDPQVKGIVIATPAWTHEDLAKQSLKAGKHVYVEKPLARTEKGAEDLIELAKQCNLALMVGHLLIYHPAVNKLKKLIAQGDLGQIGFINSDRRNLSTFRRDTNVIWDLAPHDISMISYILDIDQGEIVHASGHSTLSDGVTDVAHIDLCFGEEIYAHIHNSWIDPQKQCLLTVNGSKKTAVLNDAMPEQKLALYSIDPETEQIIVEYPVYAPSEPLRLECEHFLECMSSGENPLTDGSAGYRVVQLLERAELMMD